MGEHSHISMDFDNVSCLHVLNSLRLVMPRFNLKHIA